MLRKDTGYNVFSCDLCRELLPTEVDEIIDTTNKTHLIISKVDGKYYIYDYSNDKLLTNQNGTGYKPEFSYRGDVKFIINGQYTIYFVYDNGKLEKPIFRVNDNTWHDFKETNIPQEVMNAYYDITGQQSTVSESFKKMLRRIDDASRLGKMDMYL